MTQCTAIDTLVEAKYVIPIEPKGVFYEDFAIAVHQGKILDLLPQQEANQRYTATHRYPLPHHALLPGLINAHTHAAMTLLRGYADDLPLMTWLQEHIWPVEGRWVSPDFVRVGTELALAEMIRSGTTTFNDMYFFPNTTAEVVDRVGMRASLGLIVIDFPTAWASGPEEYLQKSDDFCQQYQNHPRICPVLAPHAPYTVSDDPLRKVQERSARHQIPIHIHLHETAFEVEEAIAKQGIRPMARLERLGLLGSQLMAVHATQLLDEEIALLAERGVHVVHCPESNLKLASGFCPVAKLLKAGVNVALGTDGAASNNDLDLLGEMRTAALLAKGVAQDASVLPAGQALEMATLGGAKALGIAQKTGSLLPGKAADILAVDLSSLDVQPVYHPFSSIVYSLSRHAVTHLWVEGKILLNNRDFTTLDESALLADIKTWQTRIQSRSS